MQSGEIVDNSGEAAGTEGRNSVLPGATIGLLGGGQLGRMFALEARRLGYRVHVFDPQPDSPAGQVGDMEVSAAFEDAQALERFACGVDVVTYEFENIPIEATRVVGRHAPVRPRGEVLHVCQNREREKRFLEENEIPCAPFRVVGSEGELKTALDELGAPAVLKIADFGYDGKGQVKVTEGEDTGKTWRAFGADRGVLEKWIAFDRELSVVCARGVDGGMETFPISENIHMRHILEFSIVPARISQVTQDRAAGIVRRIAERLDVVGLIAAEFFLTEAGELLVNELAPRPHNSGHYSFDACVTSQFEQQLRAVCGLPLGSPALLRPVVMVNLLGDLWEDGEPRWAELLADPLAKLHLYGKSVARPGRKMGHYCVFGESAEEAFERARRLKSKL
jgi:5-(carboxyamino)imidazole ribonucleotide synthase